MIYLDNSATTRVSDEAARAALSAMQDRFFNPSAAYGTAASAEKLVNNARKHIASLLSCAPEDVIYTSCATESNNSAILGTVHSVKRKGRIITTMTEHPSVYEVFRYLELRKGYEVVYLTPEKEGHVAPETLKNALTEDTVLVSAMQVNSETGAVNDLAAFSALIRQYAPEAVFHSDGVQGFGKLPFAPVPCDMYTVSGHKFHAPKGVGFLMARPSAHYPGGLMGGGQEANRRSGTTNVPGILAMDAALTAYEQHGEEYRRSMRNCKLRMAENLLSVEDAVINGPAPEEGAPHILNISFPGVRGEVLLHALEQKEIYVSNGSACSSRKKGSRVLGAMGITGARQDGTIRISLCPENTIEEMDIAAEEIRSQVRFLRKYRRR